MSQSKKEVIARKPRQKKQKHHKKRSAIISHYQFPEHAMDYDALSTVQKLQRFGYLAYFVGGCVRDILLGKVPKDFDIVTSARPQEVRQIFRNARLIGRRFKLAHLHFKNEKILEVATFRQPPSQESIEDGLIVEDNEFGTPETDAYRRDFTVNALFYDPLSREIIDFTGGLADIEARCIRSIGDPNVRFREDPIRMLRAIKFAARLNLNFDPKVQQAMVSERHSLALAARPRLQQELIRYLQGGATQHSFQLLEEYKFLGLLLPELVSWIDDSQTRKAQFAELLRCHDQSISKLWKDASKEENILSLLFWPWVQALLLGEPDASLVLNDSANDQTSLAHLDDAHSDDFQSKVKPSVKLDKARTLKLMILRLLAPSATRLGMSIKTMHSLGRILSMLILHEQNRRHVLQGGESTARGILKGGNTYESLLILKTRLAMSLDSFKEWDDIEVLWQVQQNRIQASSEQTPTRQKRTLIPSKPVIKPTERRRRKTSNRKRK